MAFEVRRTPAAPALPRVFKKPRSLRFAIRVHPIRHREHSPTTTTTRTSLPLQQLPLSPHSPLAKSISRPVFDTPVNRSDDVSIATSYRRGVRVAMVDNISDRAEGTAVVPIMNQLSTVGAHGAALSRMPAGAVAVVPGGCRNSNGMGTANVRTRSRQYSLHDSDRPDIRSLQL
ncbi:hypothetical protein HDU82_005257 [Entophlyctis luteolus]|nr:hypothetical protein HDU82_005257 [Entophlyctis luteolus]